MGTGPVTTSRSTLAELRAAEGTLAAREGTAAGLQAALDVLVRARDDPSSPGAPLSPEDTAAASRSLSWLTTRFGHQVYLRFINLAQRRVEDSNLGRLADGVVILPTPAGTLADPDVGTVDQTSLVEGPVLARFAYRRHNVSTGLNGGRFNVLVGLVGGVAKPLNVIAAHPLLLQDPPGASRLKARVIHRDYTCYNGIKSSNAADLIDRAVSDAAPELSGVEEVYGFERTVYGCPPIELGGTVRHIDWTLDATTVTTRWYRGVVPEQLRMVLSGLARPQQQPQQPQQQQPQKFAPRLERARP